MATALEVNAAETYRLVSTADTNANVVLAAPGRVVGIYVWSTSASIRYLKLYNKATSPTVGTDTPFFVVQIPNIGSNGNPRDIALPKEGLWFASGLSIAITGAAGDSDTTAILAGDVNVHIFYMRGAPKC